MLDSMSKPSFLLIFSVELPGVVCLFSVLDSNGKPGVSCLFSVLDNMGVLCLFSVLNSMFKARVLCLFSVLDSMGKPGSGILQGNFQWLGVFDQCKAVKAQGFAGQYCLPKIGVS